MTCIEWGADVPQCMKPESETESGEWDSGEPEDIVTDSEMDDSIIVSLSSLSESGTIFS